MKPLRNRQLLSAALAAVALISVPAFGQIRVGQDGHATDSSNRVGSGGYNAGGTVYTPAFNNNNIVFGDVTGIGQFQAYHERDPRQFLGPSGASVGDNFIRQSSGVPTAYQAATPGYAPQAYYGAGRDVAPPIGTERLGYSGSYVGTALTPSNPFSLGSDINSALDVQRQTLGDSTVIGAGSKFLNNVTANSQTDSNGPLGAQTQADTFLGSPLYGIQGLSAPDTADAATDSGLPIFATPSSSSNGTARFRTQNTEVNRLQREILQTNSDDQQQSLNASNSGANGNSNPQSPNAIQSKNLAQPIEGPNSKGMNSREANSALSSGNLAGGVSPQQGTRQRITLLSASQQSQQYNVLAQRLKDLTNPQVAAAQANARESNQFNRRNNPEAGTTPGPTSRPAGGSVGPGAFDLPGGPGNLNFQPVKIESLADGVRAKGLHDLLQSAEDLMRKGSYQSAVQKYNLAQRAAPNNGLIPLGRANAELGAGFYYQASSDLHQVFQADPALLLGQYDLKNWMGEKRLQFITQELTDLSKSDAKQETPAFLLAYIAYNTGREAEAQTYLQDARSRSGGHDPLLAQLEARWRLSASTGLKDNK